MAHYAAQRVSLVVFVLSLTVNMGKIHAAFDPAVRA
jgi:hypothetical protein